MRKPFSLLAVLLGWVLSSVIVTAQPAAPQKVKNVIYLIGDGMGVAQVTAASTANGKPLFMEQSAASGLAKTSSFDAYVTDSAAGGTALACGVKTNNHAVGVDPDGKPVRSILSYAKEAGKATGVVVTCAVTHATPGAFLAHQPHRKMQEEIAADIVEAGPEVLIGGGRQYFEKRADGRDLSAKLREEGYNVVYKLEEVVAATEGKWIGLLADQHLPKVTEGRQGMLEQSVAAAIKLLNRNENGFVLMVEGSQIDWGGHQNDYDYMTSELIDFDRAVKVARDFAAADGETLVVVTADHETGALALLGAKQEVKPVWSTKGHSAVMVPVFADGAGAAALTGVYENTEIFHRMFQALGFQQ
ncbi:MAG TPA: alkaline phosphatase [Chthoniobacteraceae bacterium]|nr:alkaline phosphatase [Chthoniobacteraceae bacterium]